MPSPSSKMSYHHGNVREAALAAALERVEKDGLKGLSLRAIASDINVPIASTCSSERVMFGGSWAFI